MPGEKPEFEQLYREYLDRIYGYVRAQLGNQAEAEDVTSRIFISAFQAYPRYRPLLGSPSAWLFQIARNAVLDHQRRSGRRERLHRLLARQRPAEADPAVLAQDRVLHQEVVAAVTRLPERQRQVVGLRHSGLSFQEVGAVMACSEDAAKMLYHRALRTLREALAGSR